MKNKSTIFLISIIYLTLILPILASFPQINSKREVITFYQQNSMNPILHVYFNRHFKNSKQFQDFERVLNQFLQSSGDYASIAFTDCEKESSNQLRSCRQIAKTKDNRLILATYPSSQFTTMGDLVIQGPPLSRVLDHSSDIYEAHQLDKMINQVMPNFYRELHNFDEYEQFMEPKYVPKLILFLREDEYEEMPIILKQLSVHYALKFDFGLINDLNDELMPLFKEKINKFPKMLVSTYDFENQKRIFHYYEGSLNLDSYDKVKKYLQQFALQQQRNDYLFHKIKMVTQKPSIFTVETKGQLQQFKNKAGEWVIIGYTPSDHQIPQKLYQFKQQYGNYFSYVHFRDTNFQESKKDITKQQQQKIDQSPQNKAFFMFYNPRFKQQFRIDDGQIQFNALNTKQFLSNMNTFLNKQYVVMGVKKQFAYLCAINQQSLFREHVRCLIIDEGEQQQKLKKQMNLDFQYGFTVRLQYKDEDTVQQAINKYDSEEEQIQSAQKIKVSKGMKLGSIAFEDVYKDLQFGCRMKIRELLNDFLKYPLSPVPQGSKLVDICFHPTKKCFFLLTDFTKKDKTYQQYLKEIAINYLQGYQFYELDIASNHEFMEQIGVRVMQGTSNKPDLLVYYPKTKQYVRLNKKVTKGMIEKFLRANLRNDKRLKRSKLQNSDDVILKNPNAPKIQQDVIGEQL